MKRIVLSGLAVLTMTTPAHAGLRDLAKVVLGNGSVLQRGADSCGTKLQLSAQDLLLLSVARQAAETSLPVEQFVTLQGQANVAAVTASSKPGFCDQTAKRKDRLLDAVKRAGEKLVTARVLKL